MSKKFNKTDNETVSVLMAVYNCQDTVAEAIESMIGQTYNDIQLIICDDCSTDKTSTIVQRYANEYPNKIVFIKNDKNMKLPYSLNRCLECATGKYIARMDGDDYSYPNRIDIQVNYLRNHPDVDLVGTAMEITNGKEIIGKVVKNENPTSLDSVLTNPFSHATILTYKYVYDVLDGYSLEDRAVRVEDYDLWIRFFAEGFVGKNISKVCYRVLEDENTIRRRKFKYRINGYKTAKYGVRLLNLPQKTLFKPFISLLKGLLPKSLYTLIHKTRYR